MTPVAALWTSTSSGPSAATCSRDARGGDVAAHEHGLGAERPELVRGLLGRRVRAQVADRDARRALAREAKGDRLADPARAAGDEDAPAGPAHRSPRGRGPTRSPTTGSRPSRSGSRRLGLVVLGLRRRVAEMVEEVDLLLAVAPHRVVLGQAVRSAPARAPGAGTRNAAWRARRGPRCRRRSALPSAGKPNDWSATGSEWSRSRWASVASRGCAGRRPSRSCCSRRSGSGRST